MATRETDWRSIVTRTDPDWPRNSRRVVEYRFSAPGKRDGSEKTHEGGQRVFMADYRTRGGYED